MIGESTIWPDPGPTHAPSRAPPRATIIGLSKQRRSIFCLPHGSLSAPLKVLLIACQHGDERPAHRALESLLQVSPEELARRLPNLQLAVIPEANPDGWAAHARCNADGIDLNRDHQLLHSGEAMAIHQFVRRWQPRVVLDLHSYPSRRRHLLAQDVVLDHDVFLDVPNHPAILQRPGGVNTREVLRGLLRAVIAREVRADRYAIVQQSGRVRHSTPDVVDARNGLALRYGAFTVLVEFRQPRREDSSEERTRLRAAQARALWAAIEWLEQHHGLFLPLPMLTPPPLGTLVPVRFRYKESGKQLSIVCRDARRGQPVSVTFSRYSGSLKKSRGVALPAGYAVPAENVELLAVLRRHGFTSTKTRAGELASVEKLRIEQARPPRRPGRPARKLVLSPHAMQMELDRYEIFSTRQSGGDALAVFLEPESKHGLHRFAELQVPLQAPSWYPVLRVIDGIPTRRFSFSQAVTSHEFAML